MRLIIIFNYYCHYFALVLLIKRVNGFPSSSCNRQLLNNLYPVPKSPVDNKFAIFIKGNPETYALGQTYQSKLKSLRKRAPANILVPSQKS